jgi:hypothetical protein
MSSHLAFHKESVMSGHLEMSEKQPKRKSMFNAVFKKWLPSSFIPCPSRHPCESRGPVCVHRAPLASPLDSCLRRNDGVNRPSSVSHWAPVIHAKAEKGSEGGYPHTHSRDAPYAQQRCAPAVDMPGWGQLLRTCPHPLDNPPCKPKKRRHS